jgi:hypothetical protein
MKYTEKENLILVNEYRANPCLETVDVLARKLNKPRKSIIAKLSKMGVYKKGGYKTKLGTDPITKLELVRRIEDLSGLTLPDLAKAPKGTLITLYNYINELDTTIEDTLDELIFR